MPTPPPDTAEPSAERKLHTQHPRLAVSLIAFVTVALSLFIYYSYALAARMVERYSPLIDATMELKLEVTTAHLWFEEILTGDRGTDLAQVNHHLEQAAWYARAMLEGGSNAEGRFVPLDDPKLRAHIEQVEKLLVEFGEQVEERWRYSRVAGNGSDNRGRFDEVFASLIAQTDLVETRLQEVSNEAMARFRRNQVLLVAMAVLIAIVMTSAILGFYRRIANQIQLVEAANEELRHEVERRKQAEQVLEERAGTDALTGLANRHRMMQRLGDEVGRYERYGLPFSVVLFDIDHFKQINDRYGHDVGDEVLKLVAERVGRGRRQLDCLGRWGGEEFLLLLPGTTQEGAGQLAERCRTALAATPMATAGTVTASFGVAQYCGAEGGGRLLQRADKALYRAKSAGRNRVELAGETAERAV